MLRIVEEYSELLARGCTDIVLGLSLPDAELHKMVIVTQGVNLLLERSPFALSEVIQASSDRGFSEEALSCICNRKYKVRITSGIWVHLKADVSIVKTLIPNRVGVDSTFSDPVIHGHDVDPVKTLWGEENSKFITNSDSHVLTVALDCVDLVYVNDLMEWKRFYDFFKYQVFWDVTREFERERGISELSGVLDH